MRVRHFLFTQEGKKFLHEQYILKERSTYEIAEQLEVYPNMVRRALQSHKFPIRSKSEAQSVALKTGRHKHPTKGKNGKKES